MNINKNTIWYGIGVLFLAGLFIISLLLVQTHNGSKNQTLQNSPTTTPLISIPTDKGSVTVRDFTKSPSEVVGQTTGITQTADFTIDYFAPDNSFLITLNRKPLKQARNLAEKQFLANLQIDEASACKLKVSLTVPFSVDETASGQDYGLSFCPNGIEF